MKKRLLPVLLALTLTLPLPALAKEASTGFTDVSPEDWFAPYVVVCVEEGLLNGVGEDRFAPGQVLNSDEALVMAARGGRVSQGSRRPGFLGLGKTGRPAIFHGPFRG